MCVLQSSYKYVLIRLHFLAPPFYRIPFLFLQGLIFRLFFSHPHSPGVRYNDLALLMTVHKIEFNEAVYPYCISRTPPTPGTTVIGSGYGYVNESEFILTCSVTEYLQGRLKLVLSCLRTVQVYALIRFFKYVHIFIYNLFEQFVP